MFKKLSPFVSSGLFALTLLGTTGFAVAQAVPHSLVASPDIYKVIAENEQYRVMEVTWKPGQRDQVHSHSAYAVYYLMNCTFRTFDSSGSAIGSWENRAGTARVEQAITHSVENVGKADCRLIMFEPK